ncbi:MAG: DNA repair protein RecN [Beijerinckiaceae bacterium]
MLLRLSIRDIVLIDRLDLAVDPGLLVLTGETGAGKSILLDAFALALGGRGDGGLVREGQPQGQIAAIFDLPSSHQARQIAQAADIDTEGDLILRRVQMPDGRTRAFVNDQPVSVQTLKAIGQQLVEIHGQHDDRALMDPAEHRALLDAFGGLQGDVAEVSTLHARWREAEKALAAQQERIAKARADADYLRHAAEELNKLAPQDGEETQLAERRQHMMQAEKVAGELQDVLDLLSGNDSPIPSLSSAQRRLARRADQAGDLAGPAAAALDTALQNLEEARDALERALRAADFDPRELERIEERLFAMRAASRKFNVPVEGLAALAARFTADLVALDAGEGQLKVLGKQALETRAAFDKAASALSDKRRITAGALDKAVNAELPPLKLERATFITQIASDAAKASQDGIDTIEFHVQTNPGTRPGPMMKVASGGELSRFMLALKVVLAERGSAPTLVFDEIDTGVGGAVADAIGQRLARLSRQVQVLSVTHAPQVAAQAVRHYLIAKEDVAGSNRVATRVTILEDAARREEIARMLSGAEITDEARAAASKLLRGSAAG